MASGEVLRRLVVGLVDPQTHLRQESEGDHLVPLHVVIEVHQFSPEDGSLRVEEGGRRIDLPEEGGSLRGEEKIEVLVDLRSLRVDEVL